MLTRLEKGLHDLAGFISLRKTDGVTFGMSVQPAPLPAPPPPPPRAVTVLGPSDTSSYTTGWTNLSGLKKSEFGAGSRAPRDRDPGPVWAVAAPVPALPLHDEGPYPGRPLLQQRPERRLMGRPGSQAPSKGCSLCYGPHPEPPSSSVLCSLCPGGGLPSTHQFWSPRD